MSCSSQTSPPGEGNALDGGVVGEPAHLFAAALVDEATGETATFVVGLEDLFQDFLLAAARDDEGDLVGVRHDGEGQGDSSGRGLGAVLDRGDPGVGLAQELVAREQTARVAVGATTEQDQIKDGRLDRVLAGEARHERLLVLVGQLLSVVEVFEVDGVDGRRALSTGDLVEEVLLQEAVVAVFVVKGHGPLVGEKDLPFRKLRAGFGVFVGPGHEESFGERRGEGTSRHGHLERVVPLEGGLLTRQDVSAQVGGEVVDRRVTVQVCLFTHLVRARMRVYGEEGEISGYGFLVSCFLFSYRKNCWRLSELCLNRLRCDDASVSVLGVVCS